MDRNFLTIGEQFNASDYCYANKNAYIGLAKLAAAVLGTNTLLNVFTCTPNTPLNLSVNISAGEIYQLAQVDTTAFGDLPIDTHQILKQGINLDTINITGFTAPTTPGQSVNYLIEFTLQEQDTGSDNRQFYNASPQVVNTIRQDSVFVKILAGTPAASGTQTTPAVESGFVPGFVVTIAYGQTTITADDISVHPNAPFITSTLTNALTQAQADLRYGQIATIQSGGYLYAIASGAANTYTAALTPAITAYTPGMIFHVLINVNNTGASTLNVNGKGALTIKLLNGLDLVADNLKANMLAEFYYNGTNIILLNPDPVSFLAQIDATASVPIGTTKFTNTGTPTFDPYGMWDQTNKKFIAPLAGTYRASLWAQITNGGGAYTALGTLYKNGIETKRFYQFTIASAEDWVTYGEFTLPGINVNDYFELYLRADTSTYTIEIQMRFEYVGSE